MPFHDVSVKVASKPSLNDMVYKVLGRGYSYVSKRCFSNAFLDILEAPGGASSDRRPSPRRRCPAGRAHHFFYSDFGCFITRLCEIQILQFIFL